MTPTTTERAAAVSPAAIWTDAASTTAASTTAASAKAASSTTIPDDVVSCTQLRPYGSVHTTPEARHHSGSNTPCTSTPQSPVEIPHASTQRHIERTVQRRLSLCQSRGPCRTLRAPTDRPCTDRRHGRARVWAGTAERWVLGAPEPTVHGPRPNTRLKTHVERSRAFDRGRAGVSPFFLQGKRPECRALDHHQRAAMAAKAPREKGACISEDGREASNLLTLLEPPRMAGDKQIPDNSHDAGTRQ